MESKVWQEKVKNLLKSQLKRRGVTYDDLVERLKVMGIDETANGVRIKMSRGTFSAMFFLQCLEAIGCQHLHLD